MYNESNYMYLRLPITLVSHRATTVRKVIIAYRSTSPHKEVSFIKNSENELFVLLFEFREAQGKSLDNTY